MYNSPQDTTVPNRVTYLSCAVQLTICIIYSATRVVCYTIAIRRYIYICIFICSFKFFFFLFFFIFINTHLTTTMTKTATTTATTKKKIMWWRRRNTITSCLRLIRVIIFAARDLSDGGIYYTLYSLSLSLILHTTHITHNYIW